MKGEKMKKNIFNILLVCLLIFITVYFALKISQYGMQLEEADKQQNTMLIAPYRITETLAK